MPNEKLKIMNGDVFEIKEDGFAVNKTAIYKRLIEGTFRRAGKKVRVKLLDIIDYSRTV